MTIQQKVTAEKKKDGVRERNKKNQTVKGIYEIE